jgi:hypothetical protein
LDSFYFLEFDGSDSDSLDSEMENYNSEFGMSEDEVSADNNGILMSEFEHNDLTRQDIKNILDDSEELRCDNISDSSPRSSPILSPVQSNSSMWVRCVRCGKKNDFDSNFCGKCGLQIHKVVSIVEIDAEEKNSPEIIGNIKYHYKRPVFCFGPRGM